MSATSTTTYGWSFAFGALMALRGAGAVFMPMLLGASPLALILVSPLLHHLVCASALMHPVAFLAAGLGISLVHSAVAYMFGSSAGAKVHGWLDRRGVDAQKRAHVEQKLGRAAPLVILISPSPITCAIAGAIEVPGRTFAVTIFAAQCVWMGAFLAFGLALEDTMAKLQAVLAANMLWITGALAMAAGLRWGWKRLRRRRRAGEPTSEA